MHTHHGPWPALSALTDLLFAIALTDVSDMRPMTVLHAYTVAIVVIGVPTPPPQSASSISERPLSFTNTVNKWVRDKHVFFSLKEHN